MSRYTTTQHDACATSYPITTDWRDDAACRGVESDLFFPDKKATSQLADAKRVCARCPVYRQCGDWAISQGITEGVWGGMDEDARRGRRRTAGIRAASLPDPCGTEGALRRHQREGESACQTCRRAEAVRKADAKAAATVAA